MNKHIKSIISIIVALTMLIPGSLPVFADNLYGFKDFPTGWSEAAMSHAVGNGLIYGKSSDRIAPEDNLTRAEMATIVNRAFGATVEKDISAFSDVSESAWYYKDIAKAYNMQTLYGDASGTMRPDDFIIREEAIAIVARAMVLSGYSASNLDRFKDKADISDWAIDPLASMAANGYVNGDESSNMNPKAFITREEFAQLLYNIIKHYYNPDNKQEVYKGNLMLNKPDISLENIKVDGDLVLGDGVGKSIINLTNVEITGRLLVRGAAQITLKNVTAGGGVTVKNVNRTVHFNNYEYEKIFDGIIEHTKVTYKKKGSVGGGGTSPTPPVTKTAEYKVEHYRESLDGTTFELFETDKYTDNVDAFVTAVAKVYDSATGKNEDYVGFSEDADNAERIASGTVLEDGSLTLRLYYTRDSYKLIYDYGDATTKGIEYDTIKYGNKIKFPESDTYSKDGGYEAAGWYPNKDYKTEELLDASIKIEELVDVKAGETEVTIYVKWAKFFIVTFIENSNSDTIGTYTVYPEVSSLVPEAEIPGKNKLTKPYEKGYFKNSSVSSVYNEVYEQHLIGGSWCYIDKNGNDVEFTSSTQIESDLNVRYKFRYARLELDIEIFDEKITLEVPFGKDVDGNEVRLIDSVKDGMFFNRGYIINAFDQLDAKEKLNSAYLKLAQKANEKGIELTPDKLIADDGEILKQHVKFNLFAYIDEARMKTTVVNAIKDTFSQKPELMRGVIDEMLKEQDEDVINLMDDMLVSMLSGPDAQRIKDIIADQVVKTLKNSVADTEFKKDIKDIITSEVEREINLPESEQKIVPAIKGAITTYLEDSANDAAIKELISGLIDDAYKTTDENDPVRKFVKAQITEYLSNGDALKDVITSLMADLDKDTPKDNYLVTLIRKILEDDNNIGYVEELVDIVFTQYATIDADLKDFIVDELTKELSSDIEELKKVIDIVVDLDKDALLSTLKDVMNDDTVFADVAKEALNDDNIFEKLINKALEFDDVFNELIKNQDLYEMMVDTALADDALTSSIASTVFDNSDALKSILIAIPDEKVGTLVDKIVDKQGESRIENILGAGLTDDPTDDNDYYSVAYRAALNVAEAEINAALAAGLTDDPTDDNDYYDAAYNAMGQDLATALAIGISDDANDDNDYYDIAKGILESDPDAFGAVGGINNALLVLGNPIVPGDGIYEKVYPAIMGKIAEILANPITVGTKYYSVAKDKATEIAISEITSMLSSGITQQAYPEYWDDIVTSAKDILKSEIKNNFDAEIANAVSDPALVGEIKTVALSMLSDDTTGVKSELGDYVKALADGTLKNEIIASVRSNPAAINSIISSLKTSPIRATVTEEAINTLNDDNNSGLRETIIADVIGDVLESSAKDTLLNKFSDKISSAMDAVENDQDPLGENQAFLDKIVDVVTNEIEDKEPVRNATRDLLKELMKETELVDGTPVLTQSARALKAKVVDEIVTFVLVNQDAKDYACEKLVDRISGTNANPQDREEAINFAFNALADENARNAVLDEFFGFILSASNRTQFAANVLATMFDAGTTATVRNKILNIGFEKLLTPKTDADVASLTSIIDSAIDTLANQDELRREMIEAVIGSDDGRASILEILFDELERDPTFIDDMVDIAMKGKYGDLVEKLIHEIVTSGEFEINGDNAHIAEQIVIPMLDGITADIILDRIPEKFSKFLPEEFIEKLFNEFMNEFKTNLQAAVSAVNGGATSKNVNVMIDRDVDIMNEILVPSYNKAFPTLVDKAQEFYYYNENKYVKEIVSLIDPKVLLDNTQPASVGGTGYRLRSNEDYYELLRNVTVLADDAAKWYLDNLSDDQINSMITRFESAYESNLTKLNEFVGGRIPKAKLDALVNYMKKLVDKREKIYNGTTTAAFDKTDEAYDRIISFIKEKTGADISNGATVEVTFDGSGLVVNGDEKVNIDNYDISVTVGGNTFKIDSHSVTIAGQTIDISGYVQKIADTFGTKTVTVKFTEDAAYVYSFNVGTNKAVLAAYYK